ncbi:hypothetical protein ACQYZY_28775 [Pseudomonas aeruginosa]|uniref:hypothetical protein n=1 Tax=Pseudomonas aeruginosa TaxID=287 RepID=UPI003D2900FE
MSHWMTTSASSRYAPLRYEATRPFAVRLGTRFMAHARQGVNERMRFLRQELLADIRRELNKLGQQRGPGPGQAEIANTQVFGCYHGAGKIIFDFHKSLTAALLETDVESIPLSAIPVPADSLYLHFGPGSGLTLEGDAIEGAFVSWTRYAGETPHLVIDFVSAGQFGDPYFWLSEAGEPMTGCSIALTDMSQGVIQALQTTAAEIIERNSAVLARVKETERQLAEQYGEVVSVPSPITRLGQNLPLLKKGLALVVNCLLYLGVAPEDQEEGWSDTADPHLVEQATSGLKPGTRKTAERTLANKGYIKVKFIGHQFASSTEGMEFGQSGRTVATHFRRGHFRNQPYGPERSMRKVIFIPPVVVNPGHSEAPGRIYEV